MDERELYDNVCKVLTWYEHEDEFPFDEDLLAAEMYEALAKVQNFFCEKYGF